LEVKYCNSGKGVCRHKKPSDLQLSIYPEVNWRSLIRFVAVNDNCASADRIVNAFRTTNGEVRTGYDSGFTGGSRNYYMRMIDYPTIR
jgi:hypothetical protein